MFDTKIPLDVYNTLLRKESRKIYIMELEVEKNMDTVIFLSNLYHDI